MGIRLDKKWKGITAAVLLSFSAACLAAAISYAAETEMELQTGSYSVPEGWSEKSSNSSDLTWTYQMSEGDSEITCSYERTSFAVLEYEQLRNMLTNDLVYGDVNAQISTNCTYTDAQDNLFILTSDNSSKDFRDVYYYVVGEKEYFCVHVKEYRADADDALTASAKTPAESGKSIALKFKW